MDKVQAEIESRAEFLQQLGVLLMSDIRLKIVTELSTREMSPKQFHREFAPSSTLPQIDQHFKKLTGTGWLRHVAKAGPDSTRRGGRENFYRARKLAVLDNETWALLPYSVRAAFSRTTFKQFGEQVQAAMEGQTFDVRPDRHFTWTPLSLDEASWKTIFDRLNGLFEALFEEQDDARIRTARSGEKPFVVTVGLGGFESPKRSGGANQEGESREQLEPADNPHPFEVSVARVFSDPVCLRIISELNLRPMSASQYHEEIGGESLDGICRRFSKLRKLGWLKPTGREKTGGKRRGGVERYYRSVHPAVFNNNAWSRLPNSLKATFSGTIFDQLTDEVEAAIRAGTMDARVDRHLSWSRLRLDQQGWERAIHSLDALFEFIFQEEKRALRRLNAPGQEPITMTVMLAAFESPDRRISSS